MRASIKRILAFFCSMVLVFGGCIEAFAYELEQLDAATAAIVPRYVRSAETYQSGKMTYSTVLLSESESEAIIPMSIRETGRLDLEFSYKDTVTPFLYLECDLYADASCTEKIGYSADLVYGNGKVKASYYVSSGSMVYLKLIQHRRTGIVGRAKYIIRSAIYSGADRSLQPDTAYITAVKDANQQGLYKLTVKESGLISFAVKGEQGQPTAIYTTLLNKNKKEISAKNYSVGSGSVSKAYAVTAGVYYIRLQVATARDDIVEISYTNKAREDQSGSSAAKATALKISGTAKSGYLGATSKAGNADWFKVTLSKAGVLALDISAYGDGSVMLMVTDRQGKEAWYGSKRIEAGKSSFETVKLKKGTYYIKVYKDHEQAGLAYRIKAK